MYVNVRKYSSFYRGEEIKKSFKTSTDTIIYFHLNNVQLDKITELIHFFSLSMSLIMQIDFILLLVNLKHRERDKERMSKNM